MLDNSIISLKNYFKRHKGIQRPNRYSISFRNLPAGVRYQDSDYIVDEFLLNQRAIDHVADNLSGYGLGRLLPRRQRFANGFAASFPVGGDNNIMLMFNDWFNAIYSGGYSGGGYAAPFRSSYYDDVVKNCSVILKVLDLNGNTASTFTFYEVFPTETYPIKLNSISGGDPYMKYNVIFNYRDYSHEK
jgi:hypothetical protein